MAHPEERWPGIVRADLFIGKTAEQVADGWGIPLDAVQKLAAEQAATRPAQKSLGAADRDGNIADALHNGETAKALADRYELTASSIRRAHEKVCGSHTNCHHMPAAQPKPRPPLQVVGDGWRAPPDAYGDARDRAPDEPETPDDPFEVLDTNRVAIDHDDETDLAPIPTLIERGDGRGIFPLGRVSWIAGAPGCGKTWAVYLACLEAIQQQGRVLYIDTDDVTDNFRRRTRIIGGKGVFDRYEFYYLHEPPAPSLTAALHDFLEPAPVQVVVIDSAVTSGADPTGASIEKWIKTVVKPWADAGYTTVVIDHVPKRDRPDARSGRGGVGSFQKLAEVTGVSYYVSSLNCWTDSHGGHITLRVDKDKTTTTGQNGNPNEPDYAKFVGKWDHERTFRSYVEVPDPAQRPTNQNPKDRIPEDIYIAVAQAPDGLIKTTIRKVVSGKTATIDAALNQLQEEGVITRDDHGIYRIAPDPE